MRSRFELHVGEGFDFMPGAAVEDRHFDRDPAFLFRRDEMPDEEAFQLFLFGRIDLEIFPRDRDQGAPAGFGDAGPGGPSDLGSGGKTVPARIGGELGEFFLGPAAGQEDFESFSPRQDLDRKSVV